MDNIEIFMENFRRSWEGKDNNALYRILKTLPNSLKELSKKDYDTALDSIFDEQRGLFKFLYVTLQTKDTLNFKTSLQEAFNALQYIMDLCQQEYKFYILKTIKICFDYIKTFCWFYIRKSAAETLRKLIQLFEDSELQLDDIIKHYIDSYLRLYLQKDGSVFYIVLGAIARYSPKTTNMVKFVNSIFYNLQNDLRNQLKPVEERQPQEIKIYLDCYWDMFTNFVPFEGSSKKLIYMEKLYLCLLKLCENSIDKTSKNKSIYFISTYMHHFSNFISKDYKKWHTLLNNSISEKYTVQSSLKTFYKIMALCSFKENNEEIFLYFKDYLLSNLSNKDTPIYKSCSIINGIGEFSIAYAKYLPMELNEIFHIIALRTLPFHREEYEVDTSITTFADYLKALSQILHHIPSISLYHINALTELSVLFAKKFPELNKQYRAYVINALKNTFLSISYLEKSYQLEYFRCFFREGILWSCSHPLVIDIKIQEYMENLPVQTICYKNYLTLWQSLFQIDNESQFPRQLTLHIFNEFVLALFFFIDKLNFNVKIKENSILLNTVSLLKAENEVDFRFFINLVDLYVEVFENVETILLENYRKKLIIYFIKYSYKYPLISGFYKLIKVIFNFLNDEIYFDESTYELISQYICNLLKLISGFSGELQLSCIYFIFSIPICFLKDLINQLCPVFKIAFNIGLNNLPLAFYTLNALETLMNNPDNKFSRDFVKSMVRYLEPYLSSKENLAKGAKESVKNMLQFAGDENLEELQRKILIFYGSLDPDILLDFVHEKSIETNATWNKKNFFQCEFLFPDIRLEIYFDKFIPRIIELTISVNNTIKMSACELLHTLIIVIVRRNLMDQCFNKILCHTVLRLASDSNNTIRNLYYPLIIQLIHYLSSNLMTESKISQHFIDSLFDGLTEDCNTCIRDCYGLYLKEFVEWSIKQSIGNDYRSELNLRNVIRRITNLALYPSNHKRIGAAIAFNHIFTILQDNLSIINLYWLEFFHVFIKSLESSDDVQIISAIDHVERVIKDNVSTFNTASRERRRPPGFEGVTLDALLVWLFNFCGSTNVKCRFKSLELFENLLPLSSECDRIRVTLMGNVEKIVLNNFEDDCASITVNNAKAILRSLDFYIWILKKNFLPFEFFKQLADSLASGNNFFNCLNKFVSLIVMRRAHIVDEHHLQTLIEKEEFQNLKNDIILRILEFGSTILLEKNLSNKFWTEDLNLLVSLCTFSSHNIGLSVKRLNINKKLTERLEVLLPLMEKFLPEECFSKCRMTFSLEIERNILNIKTIHDLLNNKKKICARQYFVEGLIILKHTKFIDFEREYNFTTSYLMDIVSNIFDTLKIVIMGSDTCKMLDEDIKNYLETLLQFVFEDYELTMTENIIRLILNNTRLTNSSGSVISHGEYFLEIFKKPVFEYMLKNVLETMKIIDESLDEHADTVFKIIQELLTFARENKIEESETLADAVIDRCNRFKREINGLEHRKMSFININRMAVGLKKIPSEAIKKNETPNELYSWILEELFTSNDLEKKSMFLQHFLICLTDQTSTEINKELLIIFGQLRDGDSSVWLRKLESNEMLRFQASSCFQTLLKMLAITKSLTLYQGIIKYAAGVYNHICKENIKEYIGSYFINISDSNAVKSLQIAYNMFMEFHSADERLDVLKYFLLPSMESNKPNVIQKFYEEKCDEMVSRITKNISGALTNTVDRVKIIISKIGSYNIFELIFAKFELKFLTIKHPVTMVEKSVNQILVQQAMDLRSLTTKNEEEKELLRLLHCAAFNCCAALISFKKEEEFYPFIFYEDRRVDKLIWERIVDCEKKYNFAENMTSVKKNRKTLINIRKRSNNHDDGDFNEIKYSYLKPYNLGSLSFFEDVNAYDLNDVKILTQAEQQSAEPEHRLSLSFENDELNQHECMPMISGILVHMFNNEICVLPEGPIGVEQLPQCLKYFRNSFATKHNNVRLFLMKIIGNAKNAFLPCIKAFFMPLLASINRYLTNNSLNYIVRDVLVIIIQSKYVPAEDDEAHIAQKLIEHLIQVTPDDSRRVFHYNLEIIEALARLWKERLRWPNILERKANQDRDLVVGVSLALLHAGLRGIVDSKPICDCIWASMEIWTDEESKVLTRFEVFGWILRYSDEESRGERLLRLTTLLNSFATRNRERWARCLFALYLGFGADAHSESIFNLVEPKYLPEDVWPEALDFFLKRLPYLQIDRLRAELACLDLAMYLREHSPTCATLVLRILIALVPRLTEIELRPLLLLTMRFAGPAGNPEQRRLGYTVLATAYLQYDNELYLPPVVRGLNDPMQEVRESVHELWRNCISMPGTTADRLLAILKIYAPEVSSVFTCFLCLSMLDLIVKSSNNEQPLVGGPLGFNDFVSPSWRFVSSNTYAPLFVPSLANQIDLSGSWLNVARSKAKRMPDPSQNELSWRPNQTRLASQIKAPSERTKTYKGLETTYKEKSNVTQKNFIEHVMRLVVQDWLFCKDFSVALVCQLIENIRRRDVNDDFINKLTDRFDKVLSAEHCEDDGFVAVLLEIILHSKIMNVSGQTVGRICKMPGLNALGVVLLEQNILNEETDTAPPAKKLARTNGSGNNNWIELAVLFKLMGEDDLLKSIFKHPNMFSNEMKKAVFAQIDNKWLEARNYYETAYEASFGMEKEFCLEGTLECLCELGSWSEIVKKTETILAGDYDGVWQTREHQVLLPWILRGQVQNCLQALNDGKDLPNDTFITNFDNWIQGRESIVKQIYGEEMAMLYLCGHETDEISWHSINCHLDHLREHWTRSNPLSKNVRKQILISLRAVYDINTYIESLRSLSIEKASRTIIQYWNKKIPSPNDYLSIWNIHVSYRLTFANLLLKKISEISEEDSTIFKEIIASSIQQGLRITKLAIEHKNNVIAKRHILRSELMLNQLDENDYIKLKHDFILTASKYKFACGEESMEATKILKYYLNSWEIAYKILNDNNADRLSKINTQQHLFDLALALKRAAEQNKEFLQLLVEADVLNELTKLDGADAIDTLRTYSFNIMKGVCESSKDTETAESYTSFGKYCYTYLHGVRQSDSTISDQFISSILTGMSLGSLEAAHYFPCLLKEEFYRNEESVQLFINLSNNVPSWLFLTWQAQILSYLNKPIAKLLVPILVRLVNDYPQAVMYNFRYTYEALPSLKENPEILRMYEILFSDSRIDTFFKAMHRICQPEHYLQYYLLKLIESGKNFSGSVDALIDEVFMGQISNDSSLQGLIYKVLDKHRPRLNDLKDMDYENGKACVSRVRLDLKESMKKRLNNTNMRASQINDYSPYLSNFTGDNIELEVPGQYRENVKPLPYYHIKISRFYRFVRVMDSKCNPIKIKMIGNDALTYDFLVKFGEDLILDQRLQQIFNITNKLLRTDLNCRRRHLLINTYQVIPLSKTLGLIQWVDETRSLKDFVQFSMMDKTLIETASLKYQSWIEKAGKADSLSNAYKKAVTEYDSHKVESKMNELIGLVNSDFLRKTFFTISPSIECFVSLRHNFITSYATMCAIHWITGVGDRHLDNLLIEVKSGKCYGIDFGLAFGMGIDQSIPELVPFRLTSQILMLLKPFNEEDLFGMTMIHVLKSLRNDQGPLVACFDIFIHEPLDWSKNINKQLNEEETKDIKWLPRMKIQIVEKKLNGGNPSNIMVEELANMHNDENLLLDDTFNKYAHIIKGTNARYSSKRSIMKTESLTPEEQVVCLLEQAKDLNVLGRMWAGWTPFV